MRELDMVIKKIFYLTSSHGILKDLFNYFRLSFIILKKLILRGYLMLDLKKIILGFFAIIVLFINNTNVYSQLELKDVYIETKNLSGKTYIRGRNVYITCKKFKFTGTIDCDGECIIQCQKPFNPIMFTRQGTGKFTLMICPDGFEQFNTDELKNSAPKYILDDYSNKKENIITKQIQDIRYYCSTNFIDEKVVFQEVFNELNKEISLVTQHLYDPEPVSLLKNVTVSCGKALCALLAPYFILYANVKLTYPDRPRDKIDTIFESAAGIAILAAAYKTYRAIHPNVDSKHKVNSKIKASLDKLMFIKSRIQKSLAQPYNNKSLKIIHL